MRFTRRSFDALPAIGMRHTGHGIQSAPAVGETGTGRRAQGRTGELEDFGREILEDRGGVDGGLRAYPDVVLRALLEVSVDTADGELACPVSSMIYSIQG